MMVFCFTRKASVLSGIMEDRTIVANILKLLIILMLMRASIELLG
jgi:hypothetical protein